MLGHVCEQQRISFHPLASQTGSEGHHTFIVLMGFGLLWKTGGRRDELGGGGEYAGKVVATRDDFGVWGVCGFKAITNEHDWISARGEERSVQCDAIGNRARPIQGRQLLHREMRRQHRT